MKFRIWLLSLIAAFAFSPVLAAPANNGKKDGEILEILLVVNKNEIAAAKETLKKTQNKLDTQFATLMKEQHGKNLIETLKISKTIQQKPVPSDTSKSLQKEGTELLTTLSKMDTKQFDKAYIDAMVDGHKKVLQLIDGELLVEVTNPQLKKHLETTRMHVNQHLNEALAIQQKM